MSLYILLFIGFIGGIASGAFGIGGGTIMVPALVFLAGLTQHQAQGTTLAVFLLPVGLLGVMRYFHAGNVKVNVAILVALGFILGALLGAHVIHYLSESTLRRTFGIILIVVGMRMALLK